MDKEIVPTDLQELFDVLETRQRDRFWGTVEINFQDGKIVTWRATEVHKIGGKK